MKNTLLAVALAFAPLSVSAMNAACPAFNWSEVKINGSAVEIGGKPVGTLGATDSGYVFEAIGGGVVFTANIVLVSPFIRTAAVVDCAGQTVGNILEVQTGESKSYIGPVGYSVFDASGKDQLAWSAPLCDPDKSWSLTGFKNIEVVAHVADTAGRLESKHYDVASFSQFDGRLAVVAALMKHDAEARHAALRDGGSEPECSHGR